MMSRGKFYDIFKADHWDHSEKIWPSSFSFFSNHALKRYIEEKQKDLAHLPKLLASSILEEQLQKSEALLKSKEKELHTVGRSARDTTLDSILGDSGLPGGIASAVKGIAIGYDKVEFGSREQDGSLHQLTDQRADTTFLKMTIEVLQEEIERLKKEINLAKEKETEQRRGRMMMII